MSVNLGAGVIAGGVLVSVDDSDRHARSAAIRRIRTAAGVAPEADIDSLWAAEAIVGTTADDTIVGTDGADHLQGGLGNDTMRGRGGDDRIEGGDGHDLLDGETGRDVMFGGSGDDTFLVDALGDEAFEEVDGGIDTVRSGISFALGANVERLILTGTLAIDGTGNELANHIDGTRAENTLRGGAGDDVIDGKALNDIIHGEAGNDTLIGGTGYDQMYGGTGDDHYFVDHTSDSLWENAASGIDHVTSSVLDYSLGHNVENLTLVGRAISGSGNNLDNEIVGTSGANWFDGRGGADRLIGGAGNDTYYDANDLDRDAIIELTGEGHDAVVTYYSFTLPDGVEDLTLVSSPDAVYGTGNSLVNHIVGNENANRLNGAGGLDILEGGWGNDTYTIDDASVVVRETSSGGTDRVVSSVSYTLSQNVEQLVLTGSGALNGTGTGMDNRITGNSAANRIDGGGGRDIMAGGDGGDTYVVSSWLDKVVEEENGGFDRVESGATTQTLAANVEMLTLTGTSAIDGTGNELANRIVGNGAANRIDGGGGVDILTGGLGNDTYLINGDGDVVKELANGGSDTIEASVTARLGAHFENLILTGTAAINGTGNAAANRITGNNAANILDGSLGDDVLIGLGGHDIYIVGSSGDQIIESSSAGTDTVRATVSYTLDANLENLLLVGSANLNGVGNGLGNRITGNSGANRLDGGAGVDTLIGGGGNDLYTVDAGDKILELAGGGTDDVSATASHVLALNVENLTLTGGAAINGLGNGLGNVIVGNWGGNKLSGLGGDDSLTGGNGNDVLDGGSGADVLIGGAGADTLVIDSLSDKIVELAGGGADTVQTHFSYVLGVNLERLVLTGSGRINGTGNSANNDIQGNAGANVLDGGSGGDYLAGGAGDDRYVVDMRQAWDYGEIGDQIAERVGQGIDTVESSVDWALGNHVENLVLTGSEDLYGSGNTLDNVIVGNAGSNSLDGGYGDDRMEGGAGDDFYFVQDAGDRIVERVGGGDDFVYATVNYTLDANVERVSLVRTFERSINATGNDLDNYVGGGFGANVLSGAGGDDILSGEKGADTLTGGSGVDRFNFAYQFDGRADTITDFAVAGEKIVLFNRHIDVGPVGVLAEGAFHTGAQAHDADDRIIYNKMTGAIFYDADGNGAGAAIMFARVTAGLELTHVNFDILA